MSEEAIKQWCRAHHKARRAPSRPEGTEAPAPFIISTSLYKPFDLCAGHGLATYHAPPNYPLPLNPIHYPRIFLSLQGTHFDTVALLLETTHVVKIDHAQHFAENHPKKKCIVMRRIKLIQEAMKIKVFFYWHTSGIHWQS